MKLSELILGSVESFKDEDIVWLTVNGAPYGIAIDRDPGGDLALIDKDAYPIKNEALARLLEPIARAALGD